MSEKIAIASDHAGYALKARIVGHLRARGDVEVLDLGPMAPERCDYPDYGAAVGRAIRDGAAPRGILVCGSGIGISIAANKVNGVRAALAHNAITARLARAHNDANVLCLGSRIIGETIAMEAVDAFLATAFEGGRHAERVEKIHRLEGDH
jgi:ribose 5-phosphate isomerase B